MRFYSFLFFLLFSFSLILFWKTHWPSIHGGPQPIQGSKRHKVRICIVRGGFMLFHSLSLRPNVLDVWLAKGGRDRLNTTRS